MSIYDKASLVLIPSGTKTSKVYSQKPTNGDGDFTFSRSTAATRVNASGNIEKETQNLFTYSNDLSNAVWLKGVITTTSGQSGYDGSSDAWLITKDANAYRAIEHDINNSGVYTYSVYAKANTLDKITLRDQTLGQFANFDLTNGNVSGASATSSSIEAVGGGWYRCSVTFNGSSTRLAIYIDIDVATAGSVFVQDFQVEQGLVARNYIETTTTAIYGGITDNVPRLDYTDSSCPALLLEPQRTNSITHSEYFGAWTPSGLTITDNDAASPEGVSNAAKLTLPSGSAAKRIALGSMPVTAVARSYSFFVKSDDITAVQLVHSGDIQGYARFNISTGAVGSTGSKTTSTIEDYGNGWYRCIANFDSTNAFGSTIYLYINDSATGGYGGSTSAQGDLFVYGAQYEAGSYATSYIPTYGSAVTRNEDVFKVSDVGTNNLITNDAFTLFVDISSATDSVNNFADIVALFGSANFRIETRTSGQVRSQQQGMVTSGDDFNAIPIGDTSNTKYAFTFTTSQCKIYVDGALHSTYNGVYTHDFGTLSVRNSSSLGAELKNEYRKVMLFPTALTDQEAIDLTTL